VFGLSFGIAGQLVRLAYRFGRELRGGVELNDAPRVSSWRDWVSCEQIAATVFLDIA
jgi:hypothetical protein